MPATPRPDAFTGSFLLAADQSLPQNPIPFNYSGTYVALIGDLINQAAGGTVSIPFGSIGAPGCKGLLIRYDAQPSPAAAVMLRLNGGVTDIELTPGSLLVYLNATPAAGITSAQLIFTQPCQVQVWVLGG